MLAQIALTLLLLMSPALAAPTPAKQITAIEAMRMLYPRGEHDKVWRLGCRLLWEDIGNAEALYYTGASMSQTAEKEQGSAFLHILHRVLQDPKYKDDRQAAIWRNFARNRLETLDVRWRQDQKRYAAAAAGKRFTSPEQADDLWMAETTCALHSLHGLYAWPLVGRRNHVPPDWPHNFQCKIHRSGAKLMDDIEGRKGVLFTVPHKPSHGQRSQVIVRNVGKNPVLRIGVRGYGFPFILNVESGGQTLFSKTISEKAWEDLKIDLGPAAKSDAPVILNLVVPEKQKWFEGAFLDYVDYFAE